MYRFYCPLVLCVLLFSCSDKKQKPVQEISASNVKPVMEVAKVDKQVFPDLEAGKVELAEDVFGEVISLEGIPIATKAIFQPKEVEMLVKEDYLVLKNMSGNNMIRVFKLPEMRQVHSCAKMGHGPGEFTFPRLVQTPEKDKLCYIHESTTDKLFVLKNNFQLDECSFKLPKKGNSYFGNKQVAFLSDQEFVYVGNSKGGKAVFHFNPDSLSTSSMIKHLGFSKDYRSWSAYIGDFAVNQEKNRMVFAYKYFKRLLFMDLSGTKQRSLVFKEAVQPQKGNTKSFLGPSTLTHYWGRSSQSDRVYFLYSGRTPLQVGRELQQNKEYIFVEEYDWNGNPKRKFKLDKWGYFCVDEKRNTIYIAATNAVNPFYAFKLPE